MRGHEFTQTSLPTFPLHRGAAPPPSRPWGLLAFRSPNPQQETKDSGCCLLGPSRGPAPLSSFTFPTPNLEGPRAFPWSSGMPIPYQWF